MRTFLWVLLSCVTLAACSRQPDPTAKPGNVNIRLSFTPDEISADQGSAVATVVVEGAADRPIALNDVKVATSAGFDKVGAITATGRNRFEVALVGLTDIGLSPVKVTVQVRGATQEGYLKIVPGSPGGLVVKLDSATVSADVGEVGFSVFVKDKNANLAPGAITLETTAGVVSQLTMQPDRSYRAVLTNLNRTEDSPVKLTARAGSEKSETVVQILAGELDHFTIEPLPAALVVGEYTRFRVSARDQHENLVTGFESYVNVTSSRGSGDVEVKFGSSIATFTRNFVLGTSLDEEFRVRTAAPAPGIRLVVEDSAGHAGESGLLVVSPAPANQLTIQTYTGYNLIVPADGCVKPTVSGTECEVGAVKNADNTWAYSPLSTKLEMRLRRYTNHPNERDDQAILLGGRGSEMVVSMTDAEGNVYDKNSPHTGPYLGPIVDGLNGYYTVNVYNLRDQGKSPYLVTVRFVDLVTEAEVQVVPGDSFAFEFPPVPSQKISTGGVVPFFQTSVSARDRWGNQVFSFQDAVNIYHQILGATGNVVSETFLTDSSPALLGGTFPFLVSTATAAPRSRLVAKHAGLGIEGASNEFQVFGADHFVNGNFIVLLDGQTVPATGSIPPVQASPTNIEANKPFPVRVYNRSVGWTPAVPFFEGAVQLQALGTQIEIVDSSCATGGSGTEPSRGNLTPNFVVSGAVRIPGVSESLCTLWVKATAPSENATIVVNPNFVSNYQTPGNTFQSSTFRVKPGIAKALRVSQVSTPQLATPHEPEAEKKTTIVVQAIDAAGNPTSNISCSLSVTDERGFLRPMNPAAVFNANGTAVIENVWFQGDLAPQALVNNRIVAACAGVELPAQSNVFAMITQGPRCLQITGPGSTVRAHEPFTFEARAFEDSACTAPASNVHYSFTITDSTGSSYPNQTTAFVDGVLLGQVAYVDQVAARTVLCLQGAGLKACSAPFTVIPGQVRHFQFDTASLPLVAEVGKNYPVDLQALDAGYNPVPNYKGRISLTSQQGGGRFVLPNGSESFTARVISVAEGAGATAPYNLFYCAKQTDEPCTASATKVRVRFLADGVGEYLYVTDGLGHSGVSLPHAMSVVYPPVTKFEFGSGECGGPTVLPTVYRETYFNVCFRALTVGADDGVTRVKRDYSEPIVALAASENVLAPAAIAFNDGIGRARIRIDASASDHIEFWVNHPVPLKVPLDTIAAPVTYAISVTGAPAVVTVGEKFPLSLLVSPGTNFHGSLRITDSTSTVRPECGPAQTAGTCGFVDADGVAATGNFAAGAREQWVSIPMLGKSVICFHDDRGAKGCTAPVLTDSLLDHFVVSEIPSPIAQGSGTTRLVITAKDANANTLIHFDEPLVLSYSGGSVAPTGLTGEWRDGVLDTTFSITQPGNSSGRLTVSYPPLSISAHSNLFDVEVPVLTTFQWVSYEDEPAGYVDYPATLKALNQFGEQTDFNGKVNFSATNGFAVRPVTSASFTGGLLLSQKIALDGAPGVTTVLTATRVGGGASGSSAAVTVATSTVQSFSVSLAGSSFVQGCTYQVVVTAKDGTNGNGATVPNFSGSVGLRWTGNGVPATGTPDTARLAPATSPAFVNGVATFNVKLIDQPSGFPWPAAMSLNAYVAGAGMQGNSTPFDLVSTGSCPP